MCVYTHKHECVPWHVWKSGQLAGIMLFPSTVQVEHLKLLSQICWPISFPTELDHQPLPHSGTWSKTDRNLSISFQHWDYRHVQPPFSFYTGEGGDGECLNSGPQCTATTLPTELFLQPLLDSFNTSVILLVSILKILGKFLPIIHL